MLAIITVGIPGSGKATWANAQEAKGSPDFIVLTLDDIREELCGDATNQQITPQAVEVRDHLIEHHAKFGNNLILADTNLDPSHRAKLTKNLVEHGYTVGLAVFNTPYEECKKRNNARGTAKVPDYAMARMQRLFEEQFNHLPNPTGCSLPILDSTIFQEELI